MRSIKFNQISINVYLVQSGPVPSIGQECDGQGSMPVGGLNFFEGVYIAKIGFWRVYIVKYTNTHTRNIDIEA